MFKKGVVFIIPRQLCAGFSIEHPIDGVYRIAVYRQCKQLFLLPGKGMYNSQKLTNIVGAQSINARVKNLLNLLMKSHPCIPSRPGYPNKQRTTAIYSSNGGSVFALIMGIFSGLSTFAY